MKRHLLVSYGPNKCVALRLLEGQESNNELRVRLAKQWQISTLSFNHTIAIYGWVIMPSFN